MSKTKPRLFWVPEDMIFETADRCLDIAGAYGAATLLVSGGDYDILKYRAEAMAQAIEEIPENGFAGAMSKAKEYRETKETI